MLAAAQRDTCLLRAISGGHRRFVTGQLVKTANVLSIYIRLSGTETKEAVNNSLILSYLLL